jgi:glutamate formiminotransferase / 5-formyltetrahydrofolate cyclo-ligase
MTRNLIEAIPNVSEGRRSEVVESLADTVRAVDHVHLLDYSSDSAHNRSVFTLAGAPRDLEAAVLALIDRAIHAIDLRTHQGAHPRMGAVDVLPFVPLRDATMTECIDLAGRVGAAIAARFGLPVFLYEAAQPRESRRRLEDIRRGQFEGLAAKLADPEWTPDFGPSSPHPTAGAIAIGARRPLIAFNVNLRSDRVDIARAIARAVRERSGGLTGVKALGVLLPERGVAQVSMNLTDYQQTSLRAAFNRVREEAEKRGVTVLESEIIGLVPAAALTDTTPEALLLNDFTPDRILEHRLTAAGA